jgi:hypothetical protein
MVLKRISNNVHALRAFDIDARAHFEATGAIESYNKCRANSSRPAERRRGLSQRRGRFL